MVRLLKINNCGFSIAPGPSCEEHLVGSLVHFQLKHCLLVDIETYADACKDVDADADACKDIDADACEDHLEARWAQHFRWLGPFPVINVRYKLRQQPILPTVKFSIWAAAHKPNALRHRGREAGAACRDIFLGFLENSLIFPNRHDICPNVFTSRLWTCYILPERTKFA